MTHGKGEHKVKRWQEDGGGALGVGAAHRLDCGRVGCFPDWTLCPGEIRRRCLEKQKKELTAAVTFTLCTDKTT